MAPAAGAGMEGSPERTAAAPAASTPPPAQHPLLEPVVPLPVRAAARRSVPDIDAAELDEPNMDTTKADAKRKLEMDCPIESLQGLMAVARVGRAQGNLQIAQEDAKSKKSRGSNEDSGTV